MSHSDAFILAETDAVQAAWAEGLPAEEILDAFLFLIRLGPEVGEPRSGAGRALLELGRPEEALRHHHAAVVRAPQEADVWTARAEALLTLSRPAEAQRDALRAVSCDPTDPRPRALLAAALRARLDAAAAGAVERDLAGLLATIARSRRRALTGPLLRRFHDLLHALPGSVARAPDSVRAWRRLSDLLGRTGREHHAGRCREAARLLDDGSRSQLERAALISELSRAAEAGPPSGLLEIWRPGLRPGE